MQVICASATTEFGYPQRPSSSLFSPDESHRCLVWADDQFRVLADDASKAMTLLILLSPPSGKPSLAVLTLAQLLVVMLDVDATFIAPSAATSDLVGRMVNGTTSMMAWRKQMLTVAEVEQSTGTTLDLVKPHWSIRHLRTLEAILGSALLFSRAHCVAYETRSTTAVDKVISSPLHEADVSLLGVLFDWVMAIVIRLIAMCDPSFATAGAEGRHSEAVEVAAGLRSHVAKLLRL